MKDILRPSNAKVLRQLAWSNLLLAFDYDGTLAPIVEHPDEARMRPRTRELLTRAARLYPSVVISGRTRQDVLRRLRGVGVLEAVGNHGLEPWRRRESFAARAAAWIPLLRRRLRSLSGVVVEDKVLSLAVHYRRSPARRLARERILAVASKLEDVRIIGGKSVVNLVPARAPHKGMALEAARDRLACDTALFVGDDETDEDVFMLDDPGRLVTVRVGRKASSRAGFFVRDQKSVDALLARLVELRRGHRPATAAVEAEVGPREAVPSAAAAARRGSPSRSSRRGSGRSR